MKNITRTISIHVYTFANIDIQSGQALNMTSVESILPMTQKAMKEYCANHHDCVCIHHNTDERQYTIPVERFVAACKEYAEETNNEE